MAEAASAAELQRPLVSKSFHDPSLHRPSTSAVSSLTPLQPQNLTQTKQSPRNDSNPRSFTPSTPPRASGGGPGLGPVITPTRQPSATNVRRAS